MLTLSHSLIITSLQIMNSGYREVELSRLNEGDVEGKLKAQYGEEWRAYTIPYISRLLRFDTNTNV